MITLQEIKESYKLDESGERIVSPGKFEGEPVYIPHFWDEFLNGCADEDDGETMIFHICDEDRAQFPSLANVAAVYIEQDDNGFVNSWTTERKEVKAS